MQLLKIYTRTGDDGTTGLQGGTRISKSAQRIAAYGAVDEANSVIGVAITRVKDPDLTRILERIQGELFVAGADLSNPDMTDHTNRIATKMVSGLERNMDGFEAELKPLANFILPGGDGAAALLHLARAIVRRAEVHVAALAQKEAVGAPCMAYLNRLSDLLFVLGRVCNSRAGVAESVWSADSS